MRLPVRAKFCELLLKKLARKLFPKVHLFILIYRGFVNFGIAVPEAVEFLENLDDKETLVVATHGILKKTQKTPPKEIKKAEETRKQYLENKTKNK